MMSAIEWFTGQNQIFHAFIATFFTWAVTAMGAGCVFFFVVVEELIPESQLEKNTDLATMGTVLGFSVMMTLDVALG
jgi:zinc transporter ZupT